MAFHNRLINCSHNVPGNTQVRAGVEARVKAAMTHGSLVQAELDGIKAVHEHELSMLRSQISKLQEHCAEQQQQLTHTLDQLGTSEDAAARCDHSSAYDALALHIS